VGKKEDFGKGSKENEVERKREHRDMS